MSYRFADSLLANPPQNKFEKWVHLVGLILRMFIVYQYKFQIILETQTEGHNSLFHSQWLQRDIFVIAIVCQPHSSSKISPEMAWYPFLTTKTTEPLPYHSFCV